MNEIISSILNNAIWIIIFGLAVWRFSLLVKAIIEAYQNDKKIDHEEFVAIYHQTLSYFKWILGIFGVDVDKLIQQVKVDNQLEV